MRKLIEQRIRELEEQKKALQSRLEKQQRAETTRRRMLLGSFILERLEEEGEAEHQQGGMDGKQFDNGWRASSRPISVAIRIGYCSSVCSGRRMR